MDNRPIGVFDSGIGGLTVVSAMAKIFPSEVFLYVGDTARVPYGNKSQEKIQQYSIEIASWLVKKECKLIIVACNTASSYALKSLKTQFEIPVLGVIDPGVKRALSITKNNIVGVLGTHGTIISDAYGTALKQINSEITVISQACPLFVPLVEEGWVNGSVPEEIARAYLVNMQKSEVDSVILGCTHYPLLKRTIKKVLGERVNLVDSAEETAMEVKSILNKSELYSNVEEEGQVLCHVTDSINSFEFLADRFIDTPIKKVSQVDIF
tara:strand:- start:1544 stop:2344 length:801 start_codon:yes stop_codon:yes gene_type:complete